MTVTVEPAGIAREALRVQASSSGAEAPAGGPATTGTAAGPRQVVDFALTTAPTRPSGSTCASIPPERRSPGSSSSTTRPGRRTATFGGPFGLPAVAAREGIASDDARDEVFAQALPVVDPARDLGVFVTRDEGAGADGDERRSVPGAEAAEEMQRMLQQWGYAHGRRARGVHARRTDRPPRKADGLVAGAWLGCAHAPMRLATLLGPDLKQPLKEDPDAGARAARRDPRRGPRRPRRRARARRGRRAPRAAAGRGRGANLRAPRRARAGRARRADAARVGRGDRERDGGRTTAPTSSASCPRRWATSSSRRSRRSTPAAAQEVREIEKWPETSAGHLMTTDYVAVSPRMRVAEAMRDRAQARARARRVRLHRLRHRRGPARRASSSLRDLLIADADHQNRRGDADERHQRPADDGPGGGRAPHGEVRPQRHARRRRGRQARSASSRSTTSSTSSCRSRRRTSRGSAASSRSTCRTSRRASSRSSRSAPAGSSSSSSRSSSRRRRCATTTRSWRP